MTTKVHFPPAIPTKQNKLIVTFCPPFVLNKTKNLTVAISKLNYMVVESKYMVRQSIFYVGSLIINKFIVKDLWY